MRIKIPTGINFADLNLARDPSTGEVLFNWKPIETLCDYNGLDIAVFRERHEDLVAEAQLEDEHGGGISHPPGRG